MQDTKKNVSILLALSDAPTLAILSYHLERYGFLISSAQTTDSFLEVFKCILPEIIVLDEDLPGSLKSANLCNILRNNPKTKNIKIILASKSTQTESPLVDKVIKKPFVPSELFNKLKEVSNHQTVYNNKKIIRYQDIEMNLMTYRVTRNNRPIHLGPNEFKILQCFLELPDRALSREHILNYVWGPNSNTEPRTIDVHINRLRTALKNSENELSIIKTIRSSGYALSFAAETV